MKSLLLPVAELSSELERAGFVHILGLSKYISGIDSHEASFNAHWGDLALDENYKSYTTRYRRILRYWYEHPGHLRINENNVYQPKMTYAADYIHGANRLAYANRAFIDDEQMNEILRFDLAVLDPFLCIGQSYSIDIDLFRVSSKDGKPSPTTSGRHQDGEEWLCMHFIGANNIKPVISEVLDADESRAPLFLGAMTRFLETLIVNDRTLFHAASPVEQEDVRRPAHRDLLLVSISAVQNMASVRQ